MRELCKQSRLRAASMNSFIRLAPYTIVQAKSVEEPCTRLSDGLYAEAYEVTERMRNDPDIGNGSGSYGWYIPYSSSESSAYKICFTVVHLYLLFPQLFTSTLRVTASKARVPRSS